MIYKLNVYLQLVTFVSFFLIHALYENFNTVTWLFYKTTVSYSFIVMDDIDWVMSEDSTVNGSNWS